MFIGSIMSLPAVLASIFLKAGYPKRFMLGWAD
jgi:hypothetical protein